MTIFSSVDSRELGIVGAVLIVIPSGDSFELIIVQYDPVRPISYMPDERTVAGCCVATAVVLGLAYAKGQYSKGLAQQGGDSYAEKAVIVARLINGVSTSENIKSGPFDENQLIKELFPYENNQEAFDATNDIDAVINVMGSECIGDNGCGVHKEMMDQIEKVVQSSDDPKLFQMLKPGLNVLKGTDITDIQTAITKIKKVSYASIIQKAVTSGLNVDGNIKDVDIALEVGAAVVSLKNSEDYITELGNFSALLKVKDHFDDYAKMLRLISSIIPIQQFKIDLNAAQAKYQKLMSVATPDFIKILESKLAKLAEMVPKSDQTKLVTAGYYNGFDDLKKVLEDDENDWLKEVLNLGKDLEELKTKLAPLKDLVQKLEPLNKVWKEVNFDSAQKSIYNMQSFVSNLDVFSGVYTTFSSVQTCFKDVKTGQKLGMDLSESIKILESASSQLPPLKSSIDAFATPETAKQLKELFTVLEAHKFDVAMLKKKLKEMPGLESMIENLKKLQEQLEAADIDKLKEPFKIIKEIDSTVIVPFTTWSGNLDFSTISTCLKGQNFKDEFEKMNQKLQALDSKKPSQQQMDPVKNLTDGLKKLKLEMAKIKVSTPKRGRHRRANEKLVLKNLQMSSKEIGEVNTAVQKLIKVNAMKTDVQALIDGKAQIDAVIQKESDLSVKDKLTKLWNEDTVKSLKGILDVSEALDQEIKKKEIKMINDFTPSFEVAANATVSKVDIKKLAIILDGKIQDPKVSTSLNNLKSLDLKFSKYNGANIGNLINGIQEYFDSMFDVKRCNDGLCEIPDSGIPWYYYLIGSAVILGCAGGGVWFYRHHKNKDKKKSKSSSNSVVPPKPAPAEKVTPEDSNGSKDSVAPKNPKEPEATGGCEKKLPKDAKVYPLGNGLQAVVYGPGKVAVETIASRNGLGTDRKTLKEFKKIREKQVEIADKKLKRGLEKDKEANKKKLVIPKELEQHKDLIVESAALATEEVDYNDDLNIPHEYHDKIIVAPWTKDVLDNIPDSEDEYKPSDRPKYTRKGWQDGTYTPYVIRYKIGAKYEELAGKEEKGKENNEEVVEKQKKPTGKKKQKPKDTLSESTKSMTSSKLKATASNPKTAILEEDPESEIDQAIKELDEILGHS